MTDRILFSGVLKAEPGQGPRCLATDDLSAHQVMRSCSTMLHTALCKFMHEVQPSVLPCLELPPSTVQL